ncbi:MAG TPA: hypothetical protein VIP77_04940 [Jiangellaceae bacterium]
MPDPTPPRPRSTPERGVHVIPGDVPEGVVPPSTSMRTHDPHPYVHLTFGPWEPSGHQCWDIHSGGCDDVIPERKVTARSPTGEERLVGYEFGDCPSCKPALRDQLVEALTREHQRRAGERIEASVEEHCAGFADAVLPLVETKAAARSAAVGSNWQDRAKAAERRAEHFEEHAAQINADLGIETQRAEKAERDLTAAIRERDRIRARLAERARVAEQRAETAERELAALHEGETAPPADRPAPVYTPSEWLYWFNRASLDERLDTIARIYEASRWMVTCITGRHDERLKQAERSAAGLREQLRLAHVDAVNSEARANEAEATVNTTPASKEPAS